MLWKYAAPLTALMICGAASAGAQTASTTNPDLLFSAKAASGGHAEVAMGKLALQKTNRADIREFAQRMVDDHSKMNKEMATLAQHQHRRLPRHPEGDDAAAVKQLSALSGSQFDRAYVDKMVEDHRKDIADFQQEADNGEVAPIKGLAAKSLPILKDHLAMAEKIQQATGEQKAQGPGNKGVSTEGRE